MKNQFTRRLFFLWLIISLVSVNGYAKTWRFAVVGDTHVGSSDTIAEMIPYMLADNVECILVPGDIVEGGLACSADELRTQLNRWQSLFMPFYEKGIGVYPIYGNHENDAKNNLSVWNSVFSGDYALPQNGPSGEENLTYSFLKNNALFINLDTYQNIHTINQDWLNQQFALNTVPHIFVFGHEAAFKVFHADCLDDAAIARNTFWESLSQAGVKVYFCGHDHFIDVSRIDDGDGNEANDVYQYLVGTGGGWLMDKYSNYNGENAPYSPKRIFHEMEHGYTLVEISGEGSSDLTVTIKWKKRTLNPATQKNEYITVANTLEYTQSISTAMIEFPEQKFSVYPNPALNSITVSGISGETKIFNSVGSEMWNGWIDDIREIDISAFRSGVYFVQNRNATNKFIVVK